MSGVVIKVENLTKEYRLGVINHGTLAKDLQTWWARKRGKDDPNSMVGSDRWSRGGQQVASGERQSRVEGSKAASGDLNPSTQSQTALHLSTGEQSSPTSTDKIYALRDINFSVSQGEVLGIIGANGAGKSTLLKILSRVTSPTSGSIKIKGRIGSLLEVGTGFHPELTGRENIYLNGAILGMKKWEIDKKLDEIIDFSGVERFIDTPVKRYSSGMYVRLAFAVAAHLDPEILVVDEVLAVGDAEFQKKCLGKMGDISKKEGRTVLFVSHNMGAVRQLCDRGVLIKKGEIFSSGSIEKVIDDYQGDLFQVDRNIIYFEKPENNNDAYLNEIKLENEKSERSNSFLAGDSWTCKIKIIVERDISSFVAALGVSSIDNIPIHTTYTEPESYKKGIYEFVFKEENLFLAPGKYRLAVGLSKGSSSSIIQQINEACYIEIQAHSEKIKDALSLGGGKILNRMNVSILKVG